MSTARARAPIRRRASSAIWPAFLLLGGAIAGLCASLTPRDAAGTLGWPMPVLRNPHHVAPDFLRSSWAYDPDGDDLIAFQGRTVAAVVNLPNLVSNIAIGIGISVIALLAMLPKPDRVAAGHCETCGYDLTGNQSGVCPECGNDLSAG